MQILLEHRKEVGLVGLGDADQHADHLHRQSQREVGHEVERVTPDEPVDDLDAELPDLGLESGHGPRREQPRHDAAVHRVHRRVLEDEQSRRHLDALADDVVDAALAGDERLPIAEYAVEVVVPAQRPEVVLLVEVHRRLVPEASERLVRGRVDVPVVHVVVDVGLGHRHCCHAPFLNQSSMPGYAAAKGPRVSGCARSIRRRRAGRRR